MEVSFNSTSQKNFAWQSNKIEYNFYKTPKTVFTTEDFAVEL